MTQRINWKQYNSVCSNLFQDSSDDIGVVVQVYDKLDNNQKNYKKQEFVTLPQQNQIKYFRNNTNSNHSSMKYSPCTSVSVWNLPQKSAEKYRLLKENYSQNTNCKSQKYNEKRANKEVSELSKQLTERSHLRSKFQNKQNKNKLNRCMYNQDKNTQNKPGMKRSVYIQKQPVYISKMNNIVQKRDYEQQKYIQKQLKSLLKSIQLDIEDFNKY